MDVGLAAGHEWTKQLTLTLFTRHTARLPPVATASRHTPDPNIATASSATMTGQPLPGKTTALPNHTQEIHVAPALHPQQEKHQMKTPQMQRLVATAADARSSLYTALQPGSKSRNHSKARLSHSCSRTRRHRRSNSSCCQCPRTTQEWVRQPMRCLPAHVPGKVNTTQTVCLLGSERECWPSSNVSDTRHAQL